MPTSPAEIAAELFAENPDALHLEMIRWIIVQAQITDPAVYREVVHEYHVLQQSAHVESQVEDQRLVNA